jgi:hypothetical protein
MKSRRHFLLGAATSALLAPTSAAIASTSIGAHSGFRGRGNPVVITRIHVANETRQDTEPYSVTQIVGCPFRKGDIPIGQWPQFQLEDGTPVPCTLLSALATTWSDGSLKFVPAMLQIPVPIEANKQLAVMVLSGGWLPPPSPRSLVDFGNGIAPRIEVDGLDNLSGTWVMDLVEGIVEGKKVVTYGNGAAGGVWKVRARARNFNGHHHPNLVCDFYIASLANGDGSLKGLRILGKVKLPYYDTKSTMNWMSFSRFQLCRDDNRTLIRDCFGKNFGDRRAYQFSWVSGATFAANHGYSTANSGDYAYCTRLSSTGSLPAGLSSQQSYFTGNPTSTTIGFGTNSSSPGGYLVTATSDGSGTHTATPFPYLAYFGALFTAGPSGMWDFVQGAGTDKADTPLRCRIHRKYWISTGLIPNYDTTLNPLHNAHTQYWPNCAEPVTRYLAQTGERDDIGILPSWHVRHFLTQSAGDEQVVRTVSLVGGHFSVGLESARSLTIPCVNNGADNQGKPYRGMPAPNTQFRWAPNVVRAQGFPYGDTTDPNVQLAGFNEQTTDHIPQFNYYPYLLTGEPWHLDMLIEHANNAVYQRYSPLGTADISNTSYSLDSGERNLQVSPNSPTYGDTIGGAQQREDAWASALVAAAAGICPDVNPDCRSYKAYFNDINSTTWTAAVDIYKALPPYAAKNGLWHVPSGAWPYIDHWQMAYLGAAIALAAQATENKNALIALNALAKWFDHVVSKFGGWYAGSYLTVVKSGGDPGAPLVESDREVAFYGPNINWTAGGRFTVTLYSNYVPSNGDRFIFADPESGLGEITPAGFSKYKPYYMVNLNGLQFDLANTPGGTPIPLTDNYSGPERFFFFARNSPSTGSVTSIGFPTAYNSEVLGMLNYAVAAGAKVNPATIADIAYRDQQAGTNYAPDPKWAMKNSFIQHY